MKKVLIFTTLLLAGLVGSQVLPSLIGAQYAPLGDMIRMLTMVCLSFIMIHVGYEFDIDKSNLSQYGWDYVVAFTAASFPWIFVTLYFIFIVLPTGSWEIMASWHETLLAGRFAAPTSAGVLFSMLAAAGLGATWLYQKARVLAIFDDLDTVLLMIPLKILMIGLAWQLGVIAVIMVVMISIAYIYLHKIRMPSSWPWIIGYSAVITAISELIYYQSKLIDESVPVHIEVLLPAFVLGCVIAYPGNDKNHDQTEPGSGLESPNEKRASTYVAGIFMVLVGLSMPMIWEGDFTAPGGAMSESVEPSLHSAGSPTSEASAAKIGAEQNLGRITAAQPQMSWSEIALHVLIITLISNLGKMFPAFCYRKVAHWKERLALSIGMWPRGEVGAGVLVISISYGIGGPVVTIAILSLGLNLMLTGLFIYIVKRLTQDLPEYSQGSTS